MDTYKLHTGLYGKKAEQFVTLIWNLVGIGDTDFPRLDYSPKPRHLLLQQDCFTLQMEEDAAASPNKLLTAAMFSESSPMRTWTIQAESFFDPTFCVNIELDEHGEVCCIVDRGKAASRCNTKFFLLKEFYDALKEASGQLNKLVKKVIGQLCGNKEYDGIAYLKREVFLTYKDGLEDVEFSRLKLFEKTVGFTMKDLTVFRDMVFRIAQTLHYDGCMWKPHPNLPFTEDEYYEVLGREETDPFIVSKNVIVQDKLKSVILDFISRSKDEVEKLQEKIMELKSKAQAEVISKSSEEARELSSLF